MLSGGFELLVDGFLNVWFLAMGRKMEVLEVVESARVVTKNVHVDRA